MNGWRIEEVNHKSRAHRKWVSGIINSPEMHAAVSARKGPLAVPSGITKEEFIKSLQAHSMRATMERPESEDAAWNARALPSTDGQMTLSKGLGMTDKELSDAISTRLIENYEEYFEQKVRHGDKRKYEDDTSRLTDKMKANAVQAFMDTVPHEIAPDELRKRIVVGHVKEYKKTKWIKVGFFKACWMWLTGKVDKEKQITRVYED